MKTFLPKAADIHRVWFLVDAANQPVGRLAVRIANLLRGRGKPIFTPHIDTGDFVVVVNAEKVALTGRKEEQKLYWRHSRYRGGRTTMTAEAAIATPSSGSPLGTGERSSPRRSACGPRMPGSRASPRRAGGFTTPWMAARVLK